MSVIILQTYYSSSADMQSCMFLYTVDVSWDNLHVYLALISAALLRVGWRWWFSSHMFYNLYQMWLSSDHCLFYFYMVYYKTLNICLRWLLSLFWSWHLLEGFAPFLLVLFFLMCLTFWEWFLKWSESLSNISLANWITNEKIQLPIEPNIHHYMSAEDNVQVPY